MAKEHVIAREGEIPPGERRIVSIEGREVGVFNLAGQYYALPNICFHQSGPLCEGRISGTLTARAETGWKTEWVYEGEVVTCPWHALEFHIPTGQCLAFPNRRLRTYPVKVEDGVIKVTM